MSVKPNTVPDVCEDVIVWFAEAVLVISVPVVGRVTLVAAVVVKVNAKLPDVEKASAKETFFPLVRVRVSVGVVPPKPMEWALKSIDSSRFKVFESVPAKVRVLFAVRVLPSAIVRVEAVAG